MKITLPMELFTPVHNEKDGEATPAEVHLFRVVKIGRSKLDKVKQNTDQQCASRGNQPCLS
jgi:hypothetical protein